MMFGKLLEFSRNFLELSIYIYIYTCVDINTSHKLPQNLPKLPPKHFPQTCQKLAKHHNISRYLLGELLDSPRHVNEFPSTSQNSVGMSRIVLEMPRGFLAISNIFLDTSRNITGLQAFPGRLYELLGHVCLRNLQKCLRCS